MTAQTPGCGCNSEARKRQAERQAEHFVEVIDWLATPPISAKVPPVPASQHEPDRQWMNQAEAAEYLGVTDRTIRAYIARAGAPGDQAGLFQLGDLVRQAALGVEERVGEAAHAHLAVLGGFEAHEDLVLEVRDPHLVLELLIQPAIDERTGAQEGVPGTLLLLVQPLGFGHGATLARWFKFEPARRVRPRDVTGTTQTAC